MSGTGFDIDLKPLPDYLLIEPSATWVCCRNQERCPPMSDFSKKYAGSGFSGSFNPLRQSRGELDNHLAGWSQGYSFYPPTQASGRLVNGAFFQNDYAALCSDLNAVGADLWGALSDFKKP